MWYGRNATDDDCDFPCCLQRYDQTSGAIVATLRNGNVLAFCKEHSAHLGHKGIKLKTLSEVHDEKKKTHTRNEIRRELTPKEHEDVFIKSLT